MVWAREEGCSSLDKEEDRRRLARVSRALRMKKQKDGSRRAGEPLEMAGEESAYVARGWSEAAEAAGNVERRRQRVAMGKERQGTGRAGIIRLPLEPEVRPKPKATAKFGRGPSR